MQVSEHLRRPIQPNNKYHLHIINLNPVFQRSNELNDGILYDIYTSSTCYGVLTPNPLPSLCDFPLYVTLGTIIVSFKLNEKEFLFEEEDLRLIKQFHFTVFDRVLNILQAFLIFDNSHEAETILIVPVSRITNLIDFDILRKRHIIKNIIELTSNEKMQLEVTQETFMKTIVQPWYRDSSSYIVTEVCLNKCALSAFPNEDYSSYKDYFLEKHSKFILCPNLPLLLVKGLTKRLNFIKPRGKETKRKREKLFEELTEHLLPELVVKQDFPAELWIQANFLPSILSRLSYMLKLEELRSLIASEAGLGELMLGVQPPLTLDVYLLQYEIPLEEPQENMEFDIVPMPNDLNIAPATLHINKDFSAKVLEAEFPWKDLEEPKNILKSLDVTLMEIEHYEAFINQKIDKKDNYTLKNENLNKKPLAITYPTNFVPKKIALLQNDFNNEGPTIRDMYSALTCAKTDDIVNLERLETLGDSFLKLIVSVYVSLRFPNFNEGKATQLKGRLVSNKNLYYLAKKKNLCGIMSFTKLSPKEDWLPPAFITPAELTHRILNKKISINTLYNFNISPEEQMAGTLTNETLEQIMDEDQAPDDTEDACYNNLAPYLRLQLIGDKHVADVFESLLGCYFETCGFRGKFFVYTV